MATAIEYYKVTERGFPSEFVRHVPTVNGFRIEAYRKGEWVEARDLANVFFGGEGRVERLDADPVAQE